MTQENNIGMGINDLPLWLYKEFKEECRSLHGDVHWVTLLVWHDKARAYDSIMSGQCAVSVPVEQPEAKVEEKKEEPRGVMTLGGMQY